MLPAITFSQSFLSQYKGLPYHDSRYQGGPQKIPGRVLCAYYDHTPEHTQRISCTRRIAAEQYQWM
jgi:hypothetical protein